MKFFLAYITLPCCKLYQLLNALTRKGITCVFFISTYYGFEGCSHALYNLLSSKPDKIYFLHFFFRQHFLSLSHSCSTLQLMYLFQLKPCKHHYLLCLTTAQKDTY